MTRFLTKQNLALACGALLLAGVAFWAGRVTLGPQAVAPSSTSSAVTVEATEVSVGRSVNLNVVVEQKRRALATNALSGVVTWVREDTANVQQGDVLYRVANTPVRAVAGTMPFYRDLAPGASGEDVRQLQDALVAKGVLAAANGTFGESTTRAVKAWQRALGQVETGTIPLGEVIAAPRLPAPLMVDEALTLGALVSGGEKAVLGAAGDPIFSLPLSEQQARLVPESATILVTYQGKKWDAVVAGTEMKEGGDLAYVLAASQGGPVCGADCAMVAASEKLSLLSKVTIVPPTSGPAVPVADVTSRPDGTAVVTVVDPTGATAERGVTVLGSQDGVAVLEGIAVGERVQVLAATPGR